MKVLIIEDEKTVSDILIRFLKKIDEEIEILEVLESIESAIYWLNSHIEPDLIFLDVILPDGNSFQIFDMVIIDAPIIFTTGYDEYSLQAFKVNSIDYLLKPINPVELKQSIEKYKRLTQKMEISGGVKDTLLDKNSSLYKTRFLVKSGKAYKTVHIKEVAFFCVEDKLSFIYTLKNARYLIDNTLDEIVKGLDPDVFFRINRQFIIHFPAIDSIENYFNNRLKINLKVSPREEEQVLVSSKKVSEFKTWLNR
jgi:two-component system LytT family response regulator